MITAEAWNNKKYAVYGLARSGLATVSALIAALAPVSGKDVTLVISADAAATHQSVVHAMEAARRTGLSQITFATQSSGTGQP